MDRLILIFDDDNTNIKLVSDQLKEINFSESLIHKCSSEDKLYTKKLNYNIILYCLGADSNNLFLDIDFFRNRFLDTPIIIIANYEDANLALKAIKAGAQDFLIKGEYTSFQFEKAILFAIERQHSKLLYLLNNTDYRNHFLSAPVPMWLVDVNTLKFLEVNKAAIKKYGYTEDEFLNLTLSDIRPKEDIEPMKENFKNRFINNFNAGYWRHTKKNGEIFWVHIYTNALEYNGRESRICFNIDVNDKVITERENLKLAKQLKEQKDRLDNILSSIKDGIWSRKEETLELLYANDSFFKLFGFTREQMMKDSGVFFNNIFPEDKEPVRLSLINAKNIGATDIEYRFCHPSGRIKTLQARLTYTKGVNGNPNTLNGITVDVTEAKLLEEKIKHSEQNLLATINNTKDLIWSVNRDLEIIFCNIPYQKFVYELTGFYPKAGDYVLGEWGSPTFIENRKRDYERALLGESFTTIFEEEYDGDTLYKEFSNNPIIDQYGNIVGVNCIARDISEHKKQFLKIQEQNEKLKEIAFIQSHNVRGPVASILGLASLFVLDPIEDEHNSEILEYLKVATNSLDDIIREIVDKTNNFKKM